MLFNKTAWQLKGERALIFIYLFIFPPVPPEAKEQQDLSKLWKKKSTNIYDVLHNLMSTVHCNMTAGEKEGLE